MPTPFSGRPSDRCGPRAIGGLHRSFAGEHRSRAGPARSRARAERSSTQGSISVAGQRGPRLCRRRRRQGFPAGGGRARALAACRDWRRGACSRSCWSRPQVGAPRRRRAGAFARRSRRTPGEERRSALGGQRRRPGRSASLMPQRPTIWRAMLGELLDVGLGAGRDVAEDELLGGAAAERDPDPGRAGTSRV